MSVLTHSVLSTASPFNHYQLQTSGHVLSTMTRILKCCSIVSLLLLLSISQPSFIYQQLTVLLSIVISWVFLKVALFVMKKLPLLITIFALLLFQFPFVNVTPIAEHMGEYKTLYRIKLRFFSPRLRSDVSDWIKQYAHCMLTYRWRRRGQELIFSWPVSSPFAILHVNL